ncbi:LOW QUALITY PROTEIN: G2E3-like protein, partial [Mya arenaria]
MSQQFRAAALLRQAAELLNAETSTSVPSVITTISASSVRGRFGPVPAPATTSTASAARALFAPYRRRGARSQTEAVVSHWTHKFSNIPRIHLKKHNYPKLRDCGGYELMRTPPGSRVALENILVPVVGYTSAYLADDSTLGQAIMKPSFMSKSLALHCTLLLNQMALSNMRKVWDISVVRRKLVQQAMVEAPSEEWNRKLSVTFIGEEGLDAGGLTREFFTILYENSPVFENNVFSFDSQLLYKRHYFFIGQMVVMGILSGHPGPRNLMKDVVDFIRENWRTDIAVDKIERLDAVSAIKEISDCADCNVVEKYGDLLEACGFRQLVTTENRKNAVSAIKNYYLLNRFIPSLLQFMEGMPSASLKLHNLLEMFQKYPGQGCTFLLKSDNVESLKVKEFFKPVFSQNQAEKESEEEVIFNFHQFLKNLERVCFTFSSSLYYFLIQGGKVSCTKIDVDTGTSADVVLDMRNLLQALIGCQAFPSNITEGIITFDHKSDQLTTINTCAPSINFSKLSEFKNYSSFEELMKHIIVGSYVLSGLLLKASANLSKLDCIL